MNLHSTAGSLVGKKTDTHWAQVIKTPYGYGVVEVRDEEGKAQEKGMRVIRALTEQLEKKDNAAQAVFEFVDTVWSPEMRTILLCIPKGDTVTVMLRGEGVVYLKRDGQVAKLRGREGTISGKVRSGDMVFLASRTLRDIFSEEESLQLFDHLRAEEIAEKLAFHLHEKNNSDGYAGIFLEIHGVHEGEEEKPPEQNREKHTAFAKAIHRGRTYRTHVFERMRNLRPVFHKFRSLDVRVTVLLCVLFLVSVGIGIRNEMMNKKGVEAAKSVKEIQRLYDEGMALIDLNALKGRDRLLEAKTLLESSQKIISAKTKEGRELQELQKKITEALPRATQEYEVTPELFFDVGLLKTGASISNWTLEDDVMALLDKQTKTVFSLSIGGKSGKVVGGGSVFDSANAIALHGDTVFVLVNDGIHTISLKDMSVKQLVIKKTSDWGTIKGTLSFGGNVYLLDTEKSRIWKYVATETKEASGSGKIAGFSELREYLNPDTLPNFSQALNFAIDGSVWVGTSQGQTMKFTQGREDSFVPKGVEPELGTTLFVYTDDNCNFLYVLDRDTKRVVVFEKDGTYKAQYHLKADIAPSGFVVSEKVGKVLLVVDGKLYGFSLK